MLDTVLSVSDCIALVNQTLTGAYPSVIVQGEISSFKVSREKYVFFDVKDDEGSLRCFMMVYQLRVALEDGMIVQIAAQPSLTKWGAFSLNVREVKPVGEGSIKRSFDLLKTKLQAEGLFDPARKRNLPELPEHIGLIGSVESAGYADFLKIIRSRWGGLEISVANVQVQGATAANQIMAALAHFNQAPEPVEVLVIIRGGGSAEDLAVFNEEPLVRAVAASRIPTLVGIGHEVDVSLCDLAADLRAATPSNAAQLLTPDRASFIRDLGRRLHMAGGDVDRSIASEMDHVLGMAESGLESTAQARTRAAQRLAAVHALLKQLDPHAVLARGYALVRNEKGIVSSKASAHIKRGDTLTIEMRRAILHVGVNDVTKK